jgi:RNA polymerase sigma-70 factor, ECF subfamily
LPDRKNHNQKPDLTDDRRLLAACWQAKPGAWEEFLARFGRLIYYCIHRTCGPKHHALNQDEIDDLFSEVLLHLIKDDCKKLRQYRGDQGATVATWIRTVTVRYVLDYLRGQGRKADLISIDQEEVAQEISLNNPVVRPDENLSERERDALFDRALASLDKADRNFIELYYKKDVDPEKIAKIMGVSVKTVYSRANRLKARLQEFVMADGKK